MIRQVRRANRISTGPETFRHFANRDQEPRWSGTSERLSSDGRRNAGYPMVLARKQISDSRKLELPLVADRDD
jgi:hypothetical protein